MNQIPFLGDLSLYDALYFFFIYAFLGWITEVIFATLKTGKFVNRGFLNGPLCPIYGFGMLLVILVLKPLFNFPFFLFLTSMVLTTAIELITGFILERFFHKRWWDYSSQPLNIGGYICPLFSVIWGLGVVFVIKVVHVPLVLGIQYITPLWLGSTLLMIALFITLTDLALTILQMTKLNQRYHEIDRLSEEIRKGSNLMGEGISLATQKAMDAKDKLNQKIKQSRLAKAFPELTKRLSDVREELLKKTKK